MVDGHVKVAIVQRPPTLLDRAATMDAAIDALSEAAAEGATMHRTLDVAGHYGRPDIFSLTVDRSNKDPITFT